MIFVGVVIAINYRVETLIKTNLLNLQYFEINLVMHLWILFGNILFHFFNFLICNENKT